MSQHQIAFEGQFPYWCGKCKSFIKRDQVYKRKKDGDWGDYIAAFHIVCRTEVSSIHVSHPRQMFAELMKGNLNFVNKDSRSKQLLEDSFDVAYGDFRSGRMKSEIASEFLEALKDGDHLQTFLVERGYKLQW